MMTPEHCGVWFECRGSSATPARCFQSVKAFAKYICSTGRFASFLTSTWAMVAGIDIGYHLKAAGKTVPVIYMTGNDNPRRSHVCASIRMPRLLTKPF